MARLFSGRNRPVRIGRERLWQNHRAILQWVVRANVELCFTQVNACSWSAH